MKKGDILELDITSYGKDGEGVAKLNDFVIFIPGCLIGERIRAQITDVKKSFAFAKVIKVLIPSKDRITPFCPIFFRCGGCEMQHVNYDYQLEVKRENIKNCIEKACKMEVRVDPVVTGDKKFGYRNKVQIPIKEINGEAKAGFYKQGSHIFVPFEKSVDINFGDCPLHTHNMQLFIDAVVEWVNKYKISTYDENKNVGIIRHLVLRRIDNSYSVCIVINSKNLPKQRELIESLEKLDMPFSLYVSQNLKSTNVIMGDSLVCLYGEEKIQGNALGVKFTVNPNSFLQVNDEIRDEIYKRVIYEVSNFKEAIVFDVYSGIGILSNVFAKSAKEVISIEIVKEAVADAIKLAKTNSNNNITNICGDAAIELPKAIKNYAGKNTIIVIDPPRKGCDEKVINAIIESKPKKIIYISCNPSTLGRDLSKLIEVYNIDSITPYDMFPQTKHVETVVLLTLKNQK